MGMYLGQGAPSAWMKLEPSTGLISWGVSAPPGTGIVVYVGGPGDWAVYASCGTGPDGTCGQSVAESWFGPDSTMEFMIATADGRELLRQAVRAGVVSAPVAAAPVSVPTYTPPVSSGLVPSGGGGGVSDGILSPPSDDLIGGVPNLYLGIGAAALAGLILLKKKK